MSKSKDLIVFILACILIVVGFACFVKYVPKRFSPEHLQSLGLTK